MSELRQAIKVNYESTDDLELAQKWLDNLPDLVALDFEAAKKYTDPIIENLQKSLEDAADYLEQKNIQQQLNATALSHPHHVYPTHLSIGLSESEAKVIIISTHEMLDLVMEWLVTTDVTQVWHNFNYDGKLIYHYSGGRLPKNIEDTALLAKTIANHVDTYLAKVGLKELAGKWYGDWGISADYFDHTQMFEPKVLRYAATDGAATYKLWVSINQYLVTQNGDELEGYKITTKTSDEWSPWDLLPAPEPKTEMPDYGYFYDKVAKHLIKDTLRIQMNGLPIDLNKVQELEGVLDKTLAGVQETLNNNKIIQSYQQSRYQKVIDNYIKDRESHLKSPDHFIKPFNHKNMDHRSYFMHEFGKVVSLPTLEDKLPTGISKWSANNVKKLVAKYPILKRLLDGQLNEENSEYVRNAIRLWTEHKAEIANRKFIDHIERAKKGDFATNVDFDDFNPGSSDQKHAVLTGMLGFESDKLTDAYKDYERGCRDAKRYHRPLPPEPKNKYSWDRDNIEMVQKTTTDEDIIELCQALIDYSFGAIIKNNFIKAFYEFTIDDRLHGSLKLFGAKSFRLTSSDPNLLNMPSTRSAYSKPVKQCFIAPPGYVVLAIDYGALEDRVIASLSRDENKCNIFLEGLDGHSLNAYGYFKDEVKEFMEVTGDTTTDVKKMYELVEAGNKDLKAIRQKGKPATLTKALVTNKLYDDNKQTIV